MEKNKPCCFSEITSGKLLSYVFLFSFLSYFEFLWLSVFFILSKNVAQGLLLVATSYQAGRGLIFILLPRALSWMVREIKKKKKKSSKLTIWELLQSVKSVLGIFLEAFLEAIYMQSFSILPPCKCVEFAEKYQDFK